MGREKLIKKLKSTGRASFFGAVLLILQGAFLVWVFTEEKGAAVIIAIIGSFVGGVACFIYGFDRIKGENSKFIKKYPNTLWLADDLYNTTIFENKFIIVSQRAIASKKNILGIADLYDVLGIYESIHRTNGIVTSHTIDLMLRDGRTMEISIYASKKETKLNLLLTIASYCPNAMVGHTPDMLNYVAANRKAYKQQLENNQNTLQ